MIGQLNPIWKKANVIGGGISGMLIADHLVRLGYDVTLYEKTNRLGGLISTKKTPYGIAESAAHSFLVTPPVEKWLGELNVPITPLHQNSKSRFVFRKGKLQKMPLGFWEVVKTAKKGFHTPHSGVREQATLAEWAQTYLGRDALHHLIAPFCYGIFAAEPSELVASAAFPKMTIPEGKSALGYFLLRKKSDRPKFCVPLNGMGDVIQKLGERLRENLGTNLKLNTMPNSDDLDPNSNWVLSVPAQAAADWISKVDSRTSGCLQNVRYSPLVSVTAFCENRGFSKVPSGVGALSSYDVRDPTLGILLNSSSFDGRVVDPSHSSYTVMIGGTRNPTWSTASDQEINQEVARALQVWLGYRGSPLHTEIHRWRQAIPLYNESLLEAWKSANQGFSSRPGRVIFTNYSGQVSIRGLVEELLRKVPA